MAEISDLLAQLEDVDPAEIDKEIASLQDRIDRLRLVRCWLTGEKPPKGVRRVAGKPRLAMSNGNGEANGRSYTVADATPDQKRRVVEFLEANGPSAWSQLVGGTKVSVPHLSQIIKDERVFHKTTDGRWSLKGQR